MRGKHLESHTYHEEVKTTLDAIMANDVAAKSLEGFTEDLLV